MCRRAEECEKWQGVNLQCGNQTADKTGNVSPRCQRNLGTHWGLCEFASALTAAPQKPNLEKRLGSETDTRGLWCLRLIFLLELKVETENISPSDFFSPLLVVVLQCYLAPFLDSGHAINNHNLGKVRENDSSSQNRGIFVL